MRGSMIIDQFSEDDVKDQEVKKPIQISSDWPFKVGVPGRCRARPRRGSQGRKSQETAPLKWAYLVGVEHARGVAHKEENLKRLPL